MGLIHFSCTWLAVFKRQLYTLKCYVDDHFSVAPSGDLEALTPITTLFFPLIKSSC